MKNETNGFNYKKNKSSTSPSFKKNKENRLSSTNFKSSTTLRNATVNVFLKSTIKNQDSTRDFKDFNFNNKTKKSVLVNEIAGSYPSLVTPQVMQNVNDEFNNKQLINLEDLYIQEDKLWNVLNSLRFDEDSIKTTTIDWFTFANMNSMQNLENYFHNNQTKHEINLNYMYEAISVTFIYICSIYKKINKDLISSLKTLIFYIHQNCIIITNLILQRIPDEYKNNIWYIRLKNIIFAKSIKTIENDVFYLLNQNNNLNFNSIIRMLGLIFNTKNKTITDSNFYSTFNQILTNLDAYSYQTVKNNMFMLVYLVYLAKSCR